MSGNPGLDFRSQRRSQRRNPVAGPRMAPRGTLSGSGSRRRMPGRRSPDRPLGYGGRPG